MATYDIGSVSAFLVFLDVIAVYAYCLSIKGVYPPSHPWSGLALLLLSVAMISRGRNRAQSDPSIFPRVLVALVMLSAGLWSVSALARG